MKALKILLVLVLAVVAAGLIALRNAARIAESLAARALPEASLRIGRLHLRWNRAEARELLLADKTGAPLLRAHQLELCFTVAGLLRRRLEEVLVRDAELTLHQDQAGRWNAQKIIPPPPRAARPLRIARLSLSDVKIFFGPNRFVQPFGPIRFGAAVLEFDSSRPLAATIDAALSWDNLELRALDGTWTARGMRGTGRLRTAGPSEVELAGVRVDSFGQPLCEWQTARLEFELPALLAGRRIERLELAGPRLSLWQGSDRLWNLQRLLGPGRAPTDEAPRQALRIGELVIRGAEFAVGPNMLFEGLAPVALEASLRDVDSSNLHAMTGEGIVRLPACELRLLERPVRVEGLAGQLALKFGAAAGGFFSGTGEVRAARAWYKQTQLDSIVAGLAVTERSVKTTKLAADFYGTPVTGFGAVHLNARPPWYNVGLELKQADMQRLAAAILPERFSASGSSYLYLEAVGNLQDPVTWAKLQFKTTSAGTVAVKNLRELLASTTLSAEQQQLFLLAFDRAEFLPYKQAWLNADLHARRLTVSTFFERQARWLMGLEVRPPAFEIPIDLLREKGWLP
jgi:hypothetical protein